MTRGGGIYASIVRGTRFFQPQLFLLDQPLCSLWYKIYACHRTGAGGVIARRTDDHYYGQDRYKRHSDSYRYNSDYVWMFDSIGVIELDASQNRALAGVGMVTRKKIWGAFKGGQYNESSVQKNK